MARPRKDGIEDMMRSTTLDDKEEELRSLHGNDGWTALQIIFMNCWARGVPEFDLSDEAKVRTLARKSLVTTELFLQFVESMVAVGLFRRRDYDERRVLYSPGLDRRITAVLNKRFGNRRVSEAETRQKLDNNSTETRLVLDVDVDVDVDVEKEKGSLPWLGNTPSGKAPYGEHGLVWLTTAEVQRFERELGREGLAWCIAKLDGWVDEALPTSGRPTAASLKRIKNGQNARHTFDAWVARAWREHSASLADSQAKLDRAAGKPKGEPVKSWRERQAEETRKQLEAANEHHRTT